jgi:hypothetical protein
LAVFAQQLSRHTAGMHAGKLVFAQVTDLIHPEQFRRCVRRYQGNYKVKTFSCWNQFLCMAFGQLTFRESLRDVETCLRSRRDQLYHLGIRGEVSHSTLADANRERDWRIYYDLAELIIRRAPLAPDSSSTAWNRVRSIPPPACVAIRLSDWRMLRASNIIRTSYAEFISLTPKPASAWSFSPTTSNFPR